MAGGSGEEELEYVYDNFGGKVERGVAASDWLMRGIRGGTDCTRRDGVGVGELIGRGRGCEWLSESGPPFCKAECSGG